MRDVLDPPAAEARSGMFDPGVEINLRTWDMACAFSVLTALVIGVPTRVVPNGFFRRMTPTRPVDYAFLAVASVLVGLTFALRPGRPVEGNGKVFAGGLATVLAASSSPIGSFCCTSVVAITPNHCSTSL